ncbi:hypothetical protein ACH4MM_09940 [Streptomyces pratensis]|uniref:hypothetical protein n=1 Tax=Streptomyces pratensis TaxID=1169025 RepID=UPI0037B016CC
MVVPAAQLPGLAALSLLAGALPLAPWMLNSAAAVQQGATFVLIAGWAHRCRIAVAICRARSQLEQVGLIGNCLDIGRDDRGGFAR